MSRSRDDVGGLALLTLAFACWVAAAFNIGDSKGWYFVAFAVALTSAGLALMRPWTQHR